MIRTNPRQSGNPLIRGFSDPNCRIGGTLSPTPTYWSGWEADSDKARGAALRDFAEHGAREESAMLATYDKLELEGSDARGTFG